jgi:hypothetical protein
MYWKGEQQGHLPISLVSMYNHFWLRYNTMHPKLKTKYKVKNHFHLISKKLFVFSKKRHQRYLVDATERERGLWALMTAKRKRSGREWDVRMIRSRLWALKFDWKEVKLETASRMRCENDKVEIRCRFYYKRLDLDYKQQKDENELGERWKYLRCENLNNDSEEEIRRRERERERVQESEDEGSYVEEESVCERMTRSGVGWVRAAENYLRKWKT